MARKKKGISLPSVGRFQSFALPRKTSGEILEDRILQEIVEKRSREFDEISDYLKKEARKRRK